MMRNNNTSNNIQSLLQHVILLCLLLCVLNSSNNSNLGIKVGVVQAQGLGQRFNISGPVLEYASLEFNMDFIVSDYMDDSMVGYTLYDGLDCKETNNDITENYGYLLSRLRTDLTPIGDGSGERIMKVNAVLDPNLLPASSIYNENEDGSRVTVDFCVRFSVYNVDKANPNSMEANYLENPVTLDINLSGGISIDLELSKSDFVVQQVYQDIAVEAYMCDNEDNILTIEEGSQTNQGQTVRVCISPYSETSSEGATIKSFEDFTFYRGDATQVAIFPDTDGAAADALTIISCLPGSTVCAFETLLNANFFQDGAGVVFGTGSAFLQFGLDPVEEAVVRTRDRRNLQSVGTTTKTANELLAERATKYSVEITVLPVEKMDFEDRYTDTYGTGTGTGSGSGSSATSTFIAKQTTAAVTVIFYIISLLCF
jgi:hypothetical protein